MFGIRSGFPKGRGGASLQNANQDAYHSMQNAASLHPADGLAAKRRLEEACVLLHDAAEDLESALPGMAAPAGRADLNEAIGAIMETLRLVASAHARLEREPLPDGASAD
ncbi:hypothetical protein [Roseomonas genomospecies 6]|uniref:Uncharacterized protein n=1 Tax=Roseomonas genomospecies 6 TaxID=214106 RepID=A0A9W7NHI2_9PROT|nr:hypothetical protein [Roseomonas genomospecies 6]KAA0678826.1 hypothetical protein DS843_18960 [Roseomonas genomospecies 6]